MSILYNDINTKGQISDQTYTVAISSCDISPDLHYKLIVYKVLRQV